MDGDRDSYNKGGDMKDDEDVTKEASLFSIYQVTQGLATSQDAENKRLWNPLSSLGHLCHTHSPQGSGIIVEEGSVKILFAVGA